MNLDSIDIGLLKSFKFTADTVKGVVDIEVRGYRNNGPRQHTDKHLDAYIVDTKASFEELAKFLSRVIPHLNKEDKKPESQSVLESFIRTNEMLHEEKEALEKDLKLSAAHFKAASEIFYKEEVEFNREKYSLKAQIAAFQTEVELYKEENKIHEKELHLITRDFSDIAAKNGCLKKENGYLKNKYELFKIKYEVLEKAYKELAFK